MRKTMSRQNGRPVAAVDLDNPRRVEALKRYHNGEKINTIKKELNLNSVTLYRWIHEERTIEEYKRRVEDGDTVILYDPSIQEMANELNALRKYVARSVVGL
jgi:uncharacterized protein YjcR